MHRVSRFVAIALTTLAPASATAQEQFFTSNGASIHYVERGKGELVVLVHGNGGTSELWIAAGVVDSLAKEYRVVAIDCRGYGRSDKPHDPKQYGREMGLDLVRLLDHLGVQRAHFVGYSLGAEIISQLLTSHPERFLTATLGGAGGRFRWTREDAERRDAEALEWERGVSGGPARYATVLKTWPTDEPKPSVELIKQRGDAALANPNFDRLAQAAIIRGLGDQVITPQQAAAVAVPTLGIAGSADPMRAELEELKRLRPSLRLVIVEGGTHAGARHTVRRPEFVRAVRDFLRSSDRQSPRAPQARSVTERAAMYDDIFSAHAALHGWSDKSIAA